MNSWLKISSIQTRFVLYFLCIALLPLLCTVTIISYQSIDAIKEQTKIKLAAIRDLKLESLDTWFDERLVDLRIIAGDHEIRRFVSTFGQATAPDEESLHRVAEELITHYTENNRDYHEIFLLNAVTGTIEHSSISASEGRDRSASAYFTEALRTREPYIQDIYDSSSLGGPAMVFALPVFDEFDESRVAAILVTRVNLENSLYRLLLHRTGMGATGETLIISQDMMALNELRWYERAPLRLRIEAGPAIRAVRGETGVVESADYRGVMVLAAFTYIPRMKWGFVAKQDLAETYAPINAMYLNILVLVMTVGILAYLLARFFAKSLAAPIKEMTSVATKLQSGDLLARNGFERDDELGFLAQSINRMADSLAAQLFVQGGIGEITETMVTAGNIEVFGKELLNKLMDLTDSALAAFYMRSEGSDSFALIQSIGAISEPASDFDVQGYEGELGRATMTGRIEYITNIPEDTRYVFKAVVGEIYPKSIVTIPLLEDREVVALISLASLSEYTQESRDTLAQTQTAISIAFSNLLVNERTRRLALDLTDKNLELESQSKELQSQADELREQTIELEAQHIQVQQADRLKSEFLSNMSHELRTPLNSVMALSQLMLKRAAAANNQQDVEFLRVIERNGRNLLDLINDILDLSKIEAGRMEIHNEELDPAQMIEQALISIRPLAEDKGLQLEVEKEDLPSLRSDGAKIQQILVNLLANAVKFTDEGKINISVSMHGNEVWYSVSDTGIGISAEALDNIFDAFRQADGTTTRRYGGTGLGLAICQNLAKLLGGEITVQSSIGAGSTFTLKLLNMESRWSMPGDSGQDGSVSRSNLSSAETIPSHVDVDRSSAVLVVEDNEVAALQIRTVLQEMGYRVIVATGGAQAIEMVKGSPPAAVILDLMMPEIDGFQVLQQIRSTAATAALPVLVLTAKELTEEERSLLSHNNVQQLIQKGSLDRDQLATCIALLLSDPTRPATKQSPPSLGGPPQSEQQVQGNILVVEDNPDNLFTVTAILDGLGYQYLTTADGLRCIEISRRERPSLILMDLQLPGLSGVEAARMIKADPELSHIPIVALTAKAMKGDREEIMAQGFDDYLAKPIDATVLDQTILRWIGPKEKKER